MKNNDFLDIFNNRKSIRRYKEQEISQEEIREMLDFTMKSPSSRNMQPWEFVVVESKESKDKLSEMVYSNIPQVQTSSFSLIIFARFKPENNIEKVIKGEIEAGHIASENEERYIEKLKRDYSYLDDATKEAKAIFDAGIFTANFLNTARHFGYDTNVIGGFEEEKIKEEFSPAEDVLPAIVISVGLADEEGKNTFRMPAEDITKFV